MSRVYEPLKPNCFSIGLVHVLTFDGIRQYLAEHEMEGIVWWLGNKPFCKVKRRDFGLEWPIRKPTQGSNP